ncbi:MAG: conjugal transfer protein TrbL family protein [Solirubrobacteraceae bacterium]
MALALLLAGSLAIPEPAAAFSLNPADWAVDGFKAIIEWLFGDLDQFASTLIKFLLAVPLLADKEAFPALNSYREYVVAGAWGVLGLSFTVSAVRYWLSSYSGSGAHEALMGFARTAGAILLLLLFPVVFDQLSRFVNEFTVSLIKNPAVGDGFGQQLRTTLTISTVVSGGGLTLILGVVSLVLALILVVVKVIIAVLLAVLYVLFALAVAVWPIEELSWVLRNTIQAIFGLLIFPIVWAVCFGVFAVVSADSLLGGGGIGTKILSPLYVLAALIVAFRLPFVVLRQATQAGLVPSAGRGMMNAHYARSLFR